VQNDNGSYSTDRVHGPRTNFDKTQNSRPGNQSFAQNDRGGNVKNHHHQNHSGSPSSESLIKHTYDLTNDKIYDRYDELKEVY